jgi:hypothetical protein
VVPAVNVQSDTPTLVRNRLAHNEDLNDLLRDEAAGNFFSCFYEGGGLGRGCIGAEASSL